MEKQELRAYFFNNMYLAGIHAGIQSQHTTSEMFVKYNTDKIDCDCWKGCDCYFASGLLHDWGENHKTTVVLNGGMQQNLEELYELLCSKDNPYPFAKFHEADFSLNGALTNVGVILPERIFKAPFISDDFDGDEIFEKYRFENNLSEWEIEFIKVLKSKRLFGG
ncbi:putative hyphothetical protein [Vibrio phage 496E54-1]|nr:putative hyphothetical protein [Vibrio phage 495E54-1]CAH9013792.1 putative hyphothetical protein [Vibrio phage 496E54-1]